MKIVVLAGGTSTERDVSIVSGTGICGALRQKGHQAILVDVFCGQEEVDWEDPFPAEYDVEKAAEYIGTKFGCNVLLKGGHQLNEANDLLWKDGKISWFYGERIDNPNTHGTGCTLSSAIASNLAKGYSLEISIEKAKNYISLALAAMLDLGQGNGPMNHAFSITDQK